MTDLENREAMRAIDSDNLLARILGFSDQLREALTLGSAFKPDSLNLKNISTIVFTGLGGSSIGAEFVRSWLAYSCETPIFVNRHYRLPHFVNQKTLVIASSYSGNTEETFSAAEEALKKKAQMIVITSGGKLEEMAKREGLPCLKIPKGYPPRTALGFSVVSTLCVLHSLGLTPPIATEVKETCELLERLSNRHYGLDIPEKENSAKQLARSLYGRFPVIYASSDYLEAVALRWRGELEENAKTLASHFLLPEMTHNEIVGWREPKNLLAQFLVLFLHDPGDHPRVKLRFDFSEKVIKQSGAQVISLASEGKSPLARMFSLAYLADFTSFYLAMLYGVNPTPVNVIEELKREMVRG